MIPAEQDSMALAAALPFRIIESLGVPCGYERSFKLSCRRILANRYILGLQTSDVSRDQVMDACRQLCMPQDLLEEFLGGFSSANMVFFGFEDDEQSGGIYKVYLEHWDPLREKLAAGVLPREPYLLHKGFKWPIHAPDQSLVTWYHCLPGLDVDGIRRQIKAIFRDLPAAKTCDGIQDIITAAQRRRAQDRYLFVEINEPGNPRKSFDLNLYPARLRVGHLALFIENVAKALEVPKDRLDRLMAIIRNKFFGHISGGISRTGEEYFTVYYEN